MLTRLFLAILFFTLCASGEESFEVRLTRPLKTDDRFRLAAKLALEDGISTSFNGETVEGSKTVAACRLTGDLSVVAVTRKGLPRELRLKLLTVECILDGQPAEFFKAGDELHLRKEEPENVTEVNGEAADDVQAQVIQSLLTVQAEGEVTDDDVFGTKDRVAVGAEWPVNARAAVADMEREGIKGLKPGGVSGNTKLVRLSSYEEKPSLLLRMEAKIDGQEVSLSSLPERLKATRFHSEFSEETDLPVDAASTSGHTKGLARMEVDASGTEENDGKEVKVEVKIRRRVATEISATAVK